jgi:hypothetical protein
MTLPLRSRTVRVTVTCLPSTGYSMRSLVPGGRLEVYWIVSVAWRTFRTIGVLKETLRPVGTL